MKQSTIWIGFDSRETAAFAVCRESIKRRLTRPLQIKGLVLDNLAAQGLYWRPTERRLGKLWDVISEAPMSTEFAISRFLIPHLQDTGYAIFMDCDILVRGNLARLFDQIWSSPERGSKAVWCVKHEHVSQSDTKMDGQHQAAYKRKNWSSFMIFDCEHHSNKRLSLEYVNSARGIDLHQFAWLQDHEIGELDPKWNYLVGHTELPGAEEPKAVHYTDGGPWFAGLEKLPYADEWRAELTRWASWG